MKLYIGDIYTCRRNKNGITYFPTTENVNSKYAFYKSRTWHFEDNLCNIIYLGTQIVYEDATAKKWNLYPYSLVNVSRELEKEFIITRGLGRLYYKFLNGDKMVLIPENYIDNLIRIK